jgi:pyrroloquinoline-quinone synthase
MSRLDESAMSASAFADRLQKEAARRDHDKHPFDLRMDQGELTREQLQHWVANRYYYESRLPLKDALIVAKSEDPEFRRRWIDRIHDRDGTGGGEDGELAMWLRLADGVGLDPDDVATCWNVLAGVREACDAYVDFVRTAALVEGVAASLSEGIAPDLTATRVRSWQRHYSWIPREALAPFEKRTQRARRDGEHALAFVVSEARTRRVQERCIAALVQEAEVRTGLLDALNDSYVHEQPRRAAGGRS